MPRARPTLLTLIVALSFVSAFPARGEGPDLAAARAALASVKIPPEARTAILARIEADEAAFRSLLAQALADRAADPMLFRPLDKGRALPPGYAPSDLARLDGTGLSLSRQGHRLRAPALKALEAMDAAARKDGVSLLVSSTYRSYEYQVEVWNRTVKADGLAEAEASVARPGHSQHQMGTAVDFGSITDAFAETKAGRWLAVNASRFGYSLSFPKGMSAITGYKWESWHYRYVGKAAAALEARYFGGAQLYLLLFLQELA
jgi:zinc D-Ala-D-Ala carboxypeptidase